jgi:UDP-2,3-diacylglucosamine pyrophosphatase LpxH
MKNLWISDIHLGNPNNDLRKLLTVLNKNKWDSIYLLGDIIDADALNSRGTITKEDMNFVNWLLSYTHNGGKAYYVPGNHDRLLNVLIGRTFYGITFVDEIVKEKNWGVHGDKSDIVLHYFEWLTSWGGGSIGKDFWHRLYIWIGGLRRKLIKEATARKFTRVILGHTHYPERKLIHGIDFINLGDWMGNCSWAEEENNTFTLYSWGEELKIIYS